MGLRCKAVLEKIVATALCYHVRANVDFSSFSLVLLGWVLCKGKRPQKLYESWMFPSGLDLWTGNSGDRVALFITLILDHISKRGKCVVWLTSFFLDLTFFGLCRNSSNIPKAESPICSHSGYLQRLKRLLLSGNVRHTSAEPQLLKTRLQYIKWSFFL